ncbi:MAG: response regulator [Candidatus Moranbacteria bacterium]|nr:response regulator [Candidatus Moranbacteria bacterium]
MNEKRRILIADDDNDLRSMSKEIFESEGFEVIEAANGEDALKLALEEKPDLVLTDVIMPKMDGVTLMQELRKDEWGKTVPIIALSNVDSPEGILKAIDSNVTTYLVKGNWKLEEIVGKVKEKLN